MSDEKSKSQPLSLFTLSLLAKGANCYNFKRRRCIRNFLRGFAGALFATCAGAAFCSATFFSAICLEVATPVAVPAATAALSAPSAVDLFGADFAALVNPALAVTFLAGAFLAGAFLAGAFLAGAFLAGAFLAGAFLAAAARAGIL